MVRKMIEVYCKGQKHLRNEDGLCSACAALYAYAKRKLEFCPHGDEKPFCSKCLQHCYHPSKRRDIAAVMAYSGPRMLLYHPLLALNHMLTR